LQRRLGRLRICQAAEIPLLLTTLPPNRPIRRRADRTRLSARAGASLSSALLLRSMTRFGKEFAVLLHKKELSRVDCTQSGEGNGWVTGYESVILSAKSHLSKTPDSVRRYCSAWSTDGLKRGTAWQTRLAGSRSQPRTLTERQVFIVRFLGIDMRREIMMGTPMAFFPSDRNEVGGAITGGPDATPSGNGQLVFLNAGADMDAIVERISGARRQGIGSKDADCSRSRVVCRFSRH
jgi:hypothetical protein